MRPAQASRATRRDRQEARAILAGVGQFHSYISRLGAYYRHSAMTTIDLADPKPTLEELLALAKERAGILLTQHGQPVAQVLPLSERPRQRIAPLHPGAWEVREDFDEPVTEEFLLGQP